MIEVQVFKKNNEVREWATGTVQEISYEGGFVIITLVDGRQTAIPAVDIREVEERSPRRVMKYRPAGGK